MLEKRYRFFNNRIDEIQIDHDNNTFNLTQCWNNPDMWEPIAHHTVWIFNQFKFIDKEECIRYALSILSAEKIAIDSLIKEMESELNAGK